MTYRSRLVVLLIARVQSYKNVLFFLCVCGLFSAKPRVRLLKQPLDVLRRVRAFGIIFTIHWLCFLLQYSRRCDALPSSTINSEFGFFFYAIKIPKYALEDIFKNDLNMEKISREKNWWYLINYIHSKDSRDNLIPKKKNNYEMTMSGYFSYTLLKLRGCYGKHF